MQNFRTEKFCADFFMLNVNLLQKVKAEVS